MKKCFIFFVVSIFCAEPLMAWGFYAHRKINRQAVFSLPPEMMGFYKHYIDFISENAVNPDRRRYAVKGEAEKHFIDIDSYGDSALYTLPRYWNQALDLFQETSLREKGIGPWNVYHVKIQLTEAMKRKDAKAILRLSADLGHYIGDMHVPLHTTKNYNGQLTGQYGIHGFWESRIPELLSEDFDFYVGKAIYHERPQLSVWDAVAGAHHALDSVLRFEKILSERFAEDKKYSFEERGGINTQVYSRDFTLAYHTMLAGQVERQMKRSIKMTADFWYTAWIDAGQPDLNGLKIGSEEFPKEELKPDKNLKVREHEGDFISSVKQLKQFVFIRKRSGLFLRNSGIA
ncbi:MAG: S1/P1 Nuclease [Mongoliibacter sp.]|nr:MAG: S1/P1 Nuclease [Mongoliibacter sp.]